MKKHIFFAWLPIAIASTIAIAAAYSLVQQDIRQSANDPQIEIAEDAAGALSSGAIPASIFLPVKIDMAKSLSPFGIVYDDSGRSIAASGSLNGIVPAVPAGVLDYARSHADDRLTWQPASGVRIAAVVKSYKAASSTGFILVGRSLREVELRESSLELIAGLAWVITLALTLLAVSYNMIGVRKGE